MRSHILTVGVVLLTVNAAHGVAFPPKNLTYYKHGFPISGSFPSEVPQPLEQRGHILSTVSHDSPETTPPAWPDAVPSIPVSTLPPVKSSTQTAVITGELTPSAHDATVAEEPSDSPTPSTLQASVASNHSKAVQTAAATETATAEHTGTTTNTTTQPECISASELQEAAIVRNKLDMELQNCRLSEKHCRFQRDSSEKFVHQMFFAMKKKAAEVAKLQGQVKELEKVEKWLRDRLVDCQNKCGKHA